MKVLSNVKVVVGFSNEHVMEEANKLASEAVRKM
jgi:hypothetical protein